MKKLLTGLACLTLLVNSAAQARPMTKMEWLDPKSIGIWESLNDKEKLESVQAQINEEQEPMKSVGGDFALTDDEINDVAKKTTGCIEKEIHEPDLKGENLPLQHIERFCVDKYTTILSNHKTSQKMAEMQQKFSTAKAKRDAAAAAPAPDASDTQ